MDWLSKYLYEPNLLAPGRKPVGAVEIDRTHPIGKNVEVCFVLANTQEIAGNLPTESINTQFVATEKGLAADFSSASTSRITFDDYVLTVDEPFTILWLEYLDSVNVSDGVFLLKTNVNGKALVHIYGDNNTAYRDFTIGEEDGSQDTGRQRCVFNNAQNTPTGVWRHVAFTHTGASGYQAYSGWIDGESITTALAGGFGNTAFVSNIGGQSGNNLTGRLGYFYIVNRILIETEIQSIYRDSFQFLETMNDAQIVFPAPPPQVVVTPHYYDTLLSGGG